MSVFAAMTGSAIWAVAVAFGGLAVIVQAPAMARTRQRLVGANRPVETLTKWYRAAGAAVVVFALGVALVAITAS